jgi:quercetin dioxygenase-like cupin family protein
MAKAHKDARWIFGAEIDSENAAPGVMRKVLAYCKDMMCVQNDFQKGAVGSVHSHPHTQITYVASGAFEFTIDGETKTVRQGDTMLKQDGIPHGCVCLEEGTLLDFFAPMREDFV